MAQCIEDCGKGQISNMEKGGKHDLNEGKVLKITDFKQNMNLSHLTMYTNYPYIHSWQYFYLYFYSRIKR